jgi:hypothetical protein
MEDQNGESVPEAGEDVEAALENPIEPIDAPEDLPGEELESIPLAEDPIADSPETIESPEAVAGPPADPAKPVLRDILGEMRSLIRDYPMQLDFRPAQTLHDIIHDVLIIYDVLAFCRHKSLKENIKELASQEIEALEAAVDILELRRLYLRSGNLISAYARHRCFQKLEILLAPSLNMLSDKVQFYSLAIPSKSKPFMHLRTAQGLPAASAEQYESTEISEGEKISVDQPFKIDEEGRVLPVN